MRERERRERERERERDELGNKEREGKKIQFNYESSDHILLEF